MASQTFISELKAQLGVINEMLQEIEDKAYVGVFSPKHLPKDKALYLELKAKRREIQLQIIRYQLPKK